MVKKPSNCKGNNKKKIGKFVENKWEKSRKQKNWENLGKENSNHQKIMGKIPELVKINKKIENN